MRGRWVRFSRSTAIVVLTWRYLEQLTRVESARVLCIEESAAGKRYVREAFTDELSKLVSHLTERLSGQEDGKPKIFRDSAIENLADFFRRFRSLNVGSSEQLDQLVAHVQNVVRGVEPQQLRDSPYILTARFPKATASAVFFAVAARIDQLPAQS